MNTRIEELGVLFKFLSKSRLQASDGRELGRYPFFTSSNIQKKWIDIPTYETEGLIFGTGGNASVHHVKGGFSTSTDCLVAEPIEAALVCSRYCFHYLNAHIGLLEAGFRGAGLKHIAKGYIQSIKVPLPPISEQRRIATILDHADALRAKRLEALAQLDSLTQSIFVEMFGDPAIDVQKSAIHPLESLLEESFQNGAYFPKEAYCEEGGVEMVHMSDAFGGTVLRGKLKRVSCSTDDIQKYSLTTDDILIARRSLTYEGAAKPCMIPCSGEPLIFESSFIRVKPDKMRITPLYLFHYLNNERVRQKHVRPFVTQSTISGINQSNLAQVPVIQPPLNQQHDFGVRIAVIEKLRLIQHTSLDELDSLFASLQHRAFRGEL